MQYRRRIIAFLYIQHTDAVSTQPSDPISNIKNVQTKCHGLAYHHGTIERNNTSVAVRKIVRNSHLLKLISPLTLNGEPLRCVMNASPVSKKCPERSVIFCIV